MGYQSPKWSTVLAGVLGCAAGSGVVSSYAFGLFIKSIALEFHWSRVDTTLSISMFYVGAGFGAVALGAAIARWGIRLPSLVFVTMFGLLLVYVSAMPASSLWFAILFCLMGFFAAASTLMPYALALSGWFDKRRGLVMAIANAGTSAGGVFMSHYAYWLLQNFGWRGGYVGIGLFVAIVPIVSLSLLLRIPPVQVKAAHSEPAPPWAHVFRSAPFWQIGIPLFAISIALLGVITSMSPMLTDRGVTPATAASALGLVGGASFISRFGLGLVLDRVHIRYVAATIFAIVTLGVLLFIVGGTGTELWAAAICIGLGVGAEAELVSYSASRYFSPAALSRSLGTVWIFFAWGAGLGVLVGSLSYDLYGSYQIALYIYAVLAALSIAVVLTLGAYRYGHAVEVGRPACAGQPA